MTNKIDWLPVQLKSFLNTSKRGIYLLARKTAFILKEITVDTLPTAVGRLGTTYRAAFKVELTLV